MTSIQTVRYAAAYPKKLNWQPELAHAFSPQRGESRERGRGPFTVAMLKPSRGDRRLQLSEEQPTAPIAIEAAAMMTGAAEPDARPCPRRAEGVVRRRAPMAMAAVNAPRPTGETPAA